MMSESNLFAIFLARVVIIYCLPQLLPETRKKKPNKKQKKNKRTSCPVPGKEKR